MSRDELNCSGEVYGQIETLVVDCRQVEVVFDQTRVVLQLIPFSATQDSPDSMFWGKGKGTSEGGGIFSSLDIADEDGAGVGVMAGMDAWDVFWEAFEVGGGEVVFGEWVGHIAMHGLLCLVIKLFPIETDTYYYHPL